MATSLSAQLKLSLSMALTQQSDLTVENSTGTFTHSLALANGTSANQADILWSDQRTLAAGANESLDLNGTSLKDAFQTSVAMAKIKLILVENVSGQAITIGGATNPLVGWVADPTDCVVLEPGGLFVITNPGTGYPVTATTGDLLKITNAAGGATVYNIIVIGTSA